MSASDAMAPAMSALSGRNGDASSTTHAAVSNGALIVRDQSRQPQDLSTLSRDVEHASNALTPLFDKEKEQQRLQTLQLAQTVVSQAVNVGVTYGEQQAYNAARNDTAAQAEAAAAADKALASTNSDSFGYYSKEQQYQAAYDQALKNTTAYQHTLKDYGIGSQTHALIESGANLITGLIAGNGKGAVANGKPSQDLTQSEREQISQWGQIAGGIASGLAGGGKNHAAEIGAGAQAGKNAVENNALNDHQDAEEDQDYKKCEEGRFSPVCKVGKFLFWSGVSTYQTVRSTAYVAGGMGVGAWEWAKETGEGTIHLVMHPWDSTVGAYHAGRDYVTSGDMLGIAYNGAKKVVINTASTAADAAVYGLIKEDPDKAYEAGKGLGHIGANVGSLIIPVGAVGKIGTAGKLGAAFEKVELEGADSAVKIAEEKAAESIANADKTAAEALKAEESSPKITITGTKPVEPLPAGGAPYVSAEQAKVGSTELAADVERNPLNSSSSQVGKSASERESYTGFAGSRDFQMNQPKSPSYQLTRNESAIIGSRQYTKHALDRMQDRGIMPSVVENTIKNGERSATYGNTNTYFDKLNKISVVTNETGDVVTVSYGNLIKNGK